MIKCITINERGGLLMKKEELKNEVLKELATLVDEDVQSKDVCFCLAFC